MFPLRLRFAFDEFDSTVIGMAGTCASTIEGELTMSTSTDQTALAHQLIVNGRSYGPATGPVVVICVDGSEPAYHEIAIKEGLMPFLQSVVEGAGTSLPAECAMPAFTNPNNLSIATGRPPAVHGICGNFFYDPASDAEVMMNAPELLQAPTIFASYEEVGASVAIITAKDKLRRLLGAGLSRGICFSAEKADQVTMEENRIEGALELVGMPLPSVYSADLSAFALAAGVKVLERDRPDLMYISLTDYIQHKYAPGSDVANDFYAMLDRYCAQLDALGATLVVTADHGMNAKSDDAGKPQVVYLQDLLDGWLGAGTSRVILPITDPYTAHHGALGSYATVYLPGQPVAEIIERLRGIDGVEVVLDAEEACQRYELPRDRIGDLVLVTRQDTTVGTTPERHDLSALDRPLRSHGGLSEQSVPFIVNRQLSDLPAEHRLRNYDAYWVALNFAGQTA